MISAALAVLRGLRDASPEAFRRCAGIGLSGQMHGAILLDDHDRPLRPCMLWNDGRAAAECTEIEAAEPDSRRITGNIAMPGFTAPKLLWVRRHEPDIFRRTRRVLLPKAYLRLALTGEAIEDMSDASGTLWLDVGRRDWSDRMLAATGLDRSFMPELVEGSQPAGRMRAEPAGSLASTHRLSSPAAPVTMPRVRSAWEPSRPAPASCHWGPPACSGARPSASSRAPAAPFTPSATPCRTAGTRCRFTSRPPPA